MISFPAFNHHIHLSLERKSNAKVTALQVTLVGALDAPLPYWLLAFEGLTAADRQPLGEAQGTVYRNTRGEPVDMRRGGKFGNGNELQYSGGESKLLYCHGGRWSSLWSVRSKEETEIRRGTI